MPSPFHPTGSCPSIQAANSVRQSASDYIKVGRWLKSKAALIRRAISLDSVRRRLCIELQAVVGRLDNADYGNWGQVLANDCELSSRADIAELTSIQGLRQIWLSLNVLLAAYYYQSYWSHSYYIT